MVIDASAQGPSLTMDGNCAYIDLGRPDEQNKLTRAMMAHLASLVKAADVEAVSAIVIRSQGPVFCAGRDGKNESSAGLSAVAIRQTQMQPVLDVYAAIRAASVPVVARIHGNATGFGAALAGSCDLAIASSGARFSFPEIHHGIAPTMAISSVVANVPPASLAYLVFTGRDIDADTARQMGLVGAHFPAETFDADFEAMLRDLVGKPRIILQTIKHYLGTARGMTPDAAADYAGALLALLKAS